MGVIVRLVLTVPPGETLREEEAKEAVTPGGMFWVDRATVTASPVDITDMLVKPLLAGAIGGKKLG